MLNLNELFNTPVNGVDNPYKMEEPAITPSYQTYTISAADGSNYQIKFDNRPWLGKNVQMIRIGQINPDQKKFKPLIQKIKHPLDFLGALKYVLMQHTFVNKYTAKKNGFVLLVQQDKLSIPMALVVKIAMKILLPEFKIVSADGTPTAEQLGNPGLKDGEFDVIVFRRATMSTDNVFNEPAGQIMVHGEFKGAGDKVTPATTPAPEPVKSMSAGTSVPINSDVDDAALQKIINHPYNGKDEKLYAITLQQVGDIHKGADISDGLLKTYTKAATSGDFYDLQQYLKYTTLAANKKFLIGLGLAMMKSFESNKSSLKDMPKAASPFATKTTVSKLKAAPVMPQIPSNVNYMKHVHALVATKNTDGIYSFLHKKNVPVSQAFLKWLVKIDQIGYQIPTLDQIEKAKADGTKLVPDPKPAGAVPPPAVPVPTPPTKVIDRYFWMPTRSDWAFSNGDANIGKFAQGKAYQNFEGKHVSMTLTPTDLYWFKDINEATKARNWLKQQTWQLPAQSSGRARVDKKEPLPMNTVANEDVALSLRFFPDMTGADGTAEWFLKNIEKLMMMKIIKGNSYVSTIKLSQIYKWNDGDTGEYFLNTFNTVGVTGTVAPPDASDKLTAAQAASLKKPKEGYANGLRAYSVSPQVVEWLSANPPASAEGKEPIKWDVYKSAFHTLDNQVFEVNGFELRFDTSTPEKMFKQLSSFEAMAGKKSAVVEDLKQKIIAGFTAVKSKNRQFLEKLADDNFPSCSAIKDYTGSAYGWINKTLRGSDSDESTKARIKTIDTYFNKNGKRLPKNVVVYRGQSILISEIEGLMKGNEYVMHSYVSTSTNISTANGFMDYPVEGGWLGGDSGKDIPITAAEDLPADKTAKIKCMLVITGLDRCLNVAPGEWGLHEQECEIIINRGTRIKIDKSIPIRLFAYQLADVKTNPTHALIYCTISGDGPIDYTVNEMETKNVPEKRTLFNEALEKQKLKKDVEKAITLDNFVNDGKPSKPENYPGIERWDDDIFS